MSYLLDTNTCIRLLNNSSPEVTARLAQENPEAIYLCTIVQFELIWGAYRSRRTEENLGILSRFFNQFTILPFDEQAAALCGQLRAELMVLGTPIGPYDLQIAAIALVNQLTLVTHNTREFTRIRGLQIEDWEA